MLLTSCVAYCTIVRMTEIAPPHIYDEIQLPHIDYSNENKRLRRPLLRKLAIGTIGLSFMGALDYGTDNSFDMWEEVAHKYKNCHVLQSSEQLEPFVRSSDITESDLALFNPIFGIDEAYALQERLLTLQTKDEIEDLSKKAFKRFGIRIAFNDTDLPGLLDNFIHTKYEYVPSEIQSLKYSVIDVIDAMTMLPIEILRLAEIDSITLVDKIIDRTTKEETASAVTLISSQGRNIIFGRNISVTTVAHELYHAVDDQQCGSGAIDDMDFTALNLIDARYSSSDTNSRENFQATVKLVIPSQNRTFASVYAATNVTEDKAVTFETMIFGGLIYDDDAYAGTPLHKKQQLIIKRLLHAGYDIRPFLRMTNPKK